jgi:hypothetical protein
MYTKNGNPVQILGDYMYSKSGKPIGQINGTKVFSPNGKYVGTITSDRLVYRSSDSANISSPFSIASVAGCASANAAGAAIAGDEPEIPN